MMVPAVLCDMTDTRIKMEFYIWRILLTVMGTVSTFMFETARFQLPLFAHHGKVSA
jgi:hypothetical protein